MSPLLLLALLILATFRVTWLFVHDDFPLVRRPREWLVRRTTRTRWEWLGDLVSCTWCASGWISFIVVFASDQFGAAHVDIPVLWWLAVWAGASIIAHLLPNGEEA